MSVLVRFVLLYSHLYYGPIFTLMPNLFPTHLIEFHCFTLQVKVPYDLRSTVSEMLTRLRLIFRLQLNSSKMF